MNRNKLGRKRCPKCKSVDIYKRIRSLEIRRDTHGKIPEYVKTRKIYTCRSCRYEFDVPLEIQKKV